MIYIKVRWIHDHADEPTLLYSELDSERWEVRKVEVFANGEMGFADATRSSEGTRLGELPVPPFEELRRDGHFEPEEISREEFEMVWVEATA